MVILTDQGGNELRALRFKKFDCDLNSSKDFEIRIPTGIFKGINDNGRIFVPGTEYGGMIGGIKTETATDEVILTGRSWRGILSKKIIRPPSGQDYKIVSGDINTIIAGLFEEQEIGNLFVVSGDAGVNITNYQFERYIDLLSGITKMLKSVSYKLNLTYKQREQGLPGYVEATTSPIVDLSNETELSQDMRLNFTSNDVKNGVNHLICLGQGELQERIVVDLYIQEDGTVGTTKVYTGLNEVSEVYEDTSAENEQALTERGTERLLELASYQSFNMNIEALSLNVNIGDIIGGRDYITGLSMSKPVINKIYVEENGVSKVEYAIEGEQ